MLHRSMFKQACKRAKASTLMLSPVLQRHYVKVLTESTIAGSVKEAQYAVRGAVPIRGEGIRN